jgi:hypothetical protein
MGFCDIQKSTNFLQRSCFVNVNEKTDVAINSTEPSTTAMDGALLGSETNDAPSDEDASSNAEALDVRFVRNAALCPFCKQYARPSILMFGDFGFIYDDIPEKISDQWEESGRLCLAAFCFDLIPSH